MSVIVLKRALHDIKRIDIFVRAESPKAADRNNVKFAEAFELIGEYPHIGHKSEHGTTREWVVTGLPYIIPYKIIGDSIEILRVFHTSRRRPKRWV